MKNNTDLIATDLTPGPALYSGMPEDVNAPTIEDVHNARLRWGAMSMGAILGAAADKKVGMKSFLEKADVTQRELVAKVAKDFYCGELGLTDDVLETFLIVTNLGITGAGFDSEVLVEDEPTRCVIEASKCPIVDHANMAGYENGDLAMEDLSLWCDSYDNFESAAVSPNQVLVHSHCIGKGDKYCRIICKTLPEEQARRDEESIFDYTARLRDDEFEQKPGGPWAMEGKPPELVEDLIRDLVFSSHKVQSEIAPTLYEKKQFGAELWGRIAAASVLLAGKLRGWETLVDSVAIADRPYLQKAAKERAEALGLPVGNGTARDAAKLYMSLIKGQEYGEITIEEESDDYVRGYCEKNPVVQWGIESGLGDEVENLSAWCSASRTQEAQVISSDLTHTVTHCPGKGDDVYRWVIKKN